MPDYSAIQRIHNFKSLIRYLRTDLDWPVDEEAADDLTFEYEPAELGLDERVAVKVREIKQIRPLTDKQPWGIFWIDFEPKRLPVVVMRRVLAALVRKKRAGRRTRQAVWDLRDLMFISATGEGNSRGISIAHFHDTPDGQPQMRTFSWDVRETHLYYIKNLNLEALRWPTDATDADGWRGQWSAAFTTGHREGIRTSQQLASRMAQLAAATRDLVNEVYQYEKPKGSLHTLHDSFKRVLIHDLTVDDFADMYAQTVAYGLFSARATRTGEFVLENVVALIPNTNPFLRDLLAECLKVGQGGRHQIDLDELGVGDLVETLKQADIESVLRDFGRQRRGEDPVIHFYESFLREYDAEKKVKRGVFYTPDPVVSFIVRSVDHLLRTEFDCPDGLADTGRMEWHGQTVPKVQVLDPATGTGTFLKYVIEQVYDTFTEKHKRISVAERKKKWNEYVPKHLLPRLYGFELMMAPYAVAHMKLGLALKHTEYDFASAQRLRVYLTNTLQAAHEVPRTDTPFLAHEAEAANKVKTEVPISVVLGNPPYAGFSSNMGEWIKRLVDDYRKVDGQPMQEKKVWIQNDYVKFIRYGQYLIEKTGYGILAFITDHSYLDGLNFRGMRQQLMKAFDAIWILDLHGNPKKKEKSPDGTEDQNVFDIQQGVAIAICIRKSADAKGSKSIYHANLWGSRSFKYETLLLTTQAALEYSPLIPSPPFYFFFPRDETRRGEYDSYTRVDQVFEIASTGVQTSRDDFVVDFETETLLKRIADFADPTFSDSSVREKYFKGKGSSKYPEGDTRGWKLATARRKIRGDPKWRRRITSYLYRPYDTRLLYYAEWMIDWPRLDVMQHMLGHKNLGLCVGRAGQVVGDNEWNVVFCTKQIADLNLFYRGGNVAFPLYVYPTENDGKAIQRRLLQTERGTATTQRRPNLQSPFIAELERLLDLRFVPDGIGDLKRTFGPEDVLHYSYAIYHSPSYRQRYADFLKTDFPRLPLTRNLDLFRTLVANGSELVALHLLESPVLNRPITPFVGRGEAVVQTGYPQYGDETVWINESQGFAGVPEDVWEFHIGGYQVCHKWLKDRRGRTLTPEDKAHYAKIVVAVKETIRLMGEIDAAIPGWPLE